MQGKGLPRQNLGSDNKNLFVNFWGRKRSVYDTSSLGFSRSARKSTRTNEHEPARIRTPVRRSEAGCTIQAILRALGLLLFVEGI